MHQGPFFNLKLFKYISLFLTMPPHRHPSPLLPHSLLTHAPYKDLPNSSLGDQEQEHQSHQSRSLPVSLLQNKPGREDHGSRRGSISKIGPAWPLWKNQKAVSRWQWWGVETFKKEGKNDHRFRHHFCLGQAWRKLATKPKWKATSEVNQNLKHIPIHSFIHSFGGRFVLELMVSIHIYSHSLKKNECMCIQMNKMGTV